MADFSKSNLAEAGILDIQDACFVIVRTEWNKAVVDELEKGCSRQLKAAGAADIRVVTVPGAFEIAFAVKSCWQKAGGGPAPHAFIALGCVLRGDTPHFDYICQAVTDGLVQLNLQIPVPVIYGVLTVNNQQQAAERTGGLHGHKGEEAAITAIRMVNLNHRINNNQDYFYRP